MQQVGTHAMLARAQRVNARLQPVPPRVNPLQAMRIAGRQTFVLHRRFWVRMFAAAIAVAGVVGVYETRGHIGALAATLFQLAEDEFAVIGFGVHTIDISGQRLATEATILEALALSPTISTLNFDAAAALARVEALPAIASATIRKVYPGRVVIDVVEKVPIARWRVDGVTFLVDAAGEQIGEDRGAWVDLPLVIGDGAADDALIIIRALEQFEGLKAHLVAVSRIADRRWDLIYDTGLRIQLPETGVAQALRQLLLLDEKFQLLDRDVTIVDLRVPGLLALKPAIREVAEEDATP